MGRVILLLRATHSNSLAPLVHELAATLAGRARCLLPLPLSLIATLAHYAPLSHCPIRSLEVDPTRRVAAAARSYVSIPQACRTSKLASINSIAVYACCCKYFVVCAPEVTHVDTRLPCSPETYLRRGCDSTRRKLRRFHIAVTRVAG